MILPSYPRAQYEHHRKAIDAAIRRVLDSDVHILGPEVEAFEEAFAAYCGTTFAVGCGNGTDAITLALMALGIGPGDEVVTVSHTAVATIAGVERSGATPVLVDVDPITRCMNPALAAKALTKRTKAILPVHLYGQPCDLKALSKLDLPIIEDCAQATGAQIGPKRTGATGIMGTFSFFPTKNLGGIGDGGAVVTGDETLATRLRALRQYGWDENRNSRMAGMNSRLDALQAAILGAKLPHLDADNQSRRLIAARYWTELDLPGLEHPSQGDGTTPVFHLYVVRLADQATRDGLKAHLAENGILAGLHYPVPAHRMPAYENLPGAGDLPVTEALAGTVLTLPCYPELSPDDQDRVIASVRAFFGKRP
ncbi:MAG: DegT/DnrJ/EryC1/StrS family aminotransferase [Rhodospirillales bacterium]